MTCPRPPFLAHPKLLGGSLTGDVGFDPLGFAGGDKIALATMHEAEIEHGRYAMLAAVGWPMAELYDRSITGFLGLEPALTSTGASPSILNGGLDKIEPDYWVIVASLAGIAELAKSAWRRWTMTARRSRVTWQEIAASVR